MYTNGKKELICQVCHSVMPFKLKNGAWYFEAVQFIPGRKRMHKVNVIALCPLCTAKYKNVRETKNELLLEGLLDIDVEATAGTVDLPIMLDGKRVTIRFTGKHAIDLQSALKVAGEER
jgi:hypothetical protein